MRPTNIEMSRKGVKWNLKEEQSGSVLTNAGKASIVARLHIATCRTWVGTSTGCDLNAT